MCGALPLVRAGLRFAQPLCASKDGFTLHAATRAGALDAEPREALLEDVLRRRSHAFEHAAAASSPGIELRSSRLKLRAGSERVIFPRPLAAAPWQQSPVQTVVLYVAAVVFVATLIRSSFGFGEALVAVPLLSLLIPIQVAAPVAVLVSITVATIVVAQDWRDVQVRSAGWLVLATIAGIPFGLWLLTGVEPRVVKAVLGSVILAFASYSLVSRAPLHLERDKLAWLIGCGFFAGVFGGAYGMNGPPLVVYGSLRRWSAQQFRATLQAYFLPASVLGMGAYAYAGLWVPLVTRYYFWSLPGALVATALGRALNRRLCERGFLRYVYVGLLVAGVALLAQSVGAHPS